MIHFFPRHSAAFLLILLSRAEIVLAQEDLVPSPVATSTGLQVRSVSAYFDYYSSTVPNGLAFQTVKLPSDAAFGGSAEIGWTKNSERSNASFNYLSSLTGRVRFSELNSWNHALSFTASRKLVPRWALGFSVGGNLTSVEQSLFTPTTLSNVASVRTSFDELASALLASKFTNPQLASVLTSAPLVESPVGNVLYGDRMLTAGARTSLSYSYSPRLSISFEAGVNRSQHVSQNLASLSRNNYLIPNTTSGTAGMTVSYSLSPRTQIGASVTTARTASSEQDAYITNSLATMGWTLNRRWIVQLHGGLGVTNPVRQTSLQLSTRPRPVAGGSLAFKTFEHIFLGSADHTVSDSYGLGASSTSSAALTWRWNRPGRRWWVESSFTWQQLHGAGFGDTSGWRIAEGFGRTIATHLALFTQYAYMNNSGRLQTNVYAVDQNAVRVSIVWSPHPELAP